MTQPDEARSETVTAGTGDTPASIAEREAEQAYPTQYWDSHPTVKRIFEVDSDDLQEAYMNGRLHPACGEEIEAVAKRLMWSDEAPRWEKTYGTAPDEEFFWKRAEAVGTREGYLAFAKELLETARRTVMEGLL